MLPPEPLVLAARQGLPDAQAALSGAVRRLGYFNVSWYGTNVSDEIGSFALVKANGVLTDFVGDVLEVTLKRKSVFVYVIGTAMDLATDLAITRRAFLAVSLLAYDPIFASVGVKL